MLPALQINNAGDGGLYAEMVRDRSFEALAAQPLPTEAGMKVYPYRPGSPPSLAMPSWIACTRWGPSYNTVCSAIQDLRLILYAEWEF